MGWKHTPRKTIPPGLEIVTLLFDGARRDYPCVYFLVLRNKVVYVGETYDMEQRSAGHATRQYDRVLFTPAPEEACERKVLEGALIEVFKLSIFYHAKYDSIRMNAALKAAGVKAVLPNKVPTPTRLQLCSDSYQALTREARKFSDVETQDWDMESAASRKIAWENSTVEERQQWVIPYGAFKGET